MSFASILSLAEQLKEGTIVFLADAAIYGIALYTIGKPNSAKRRAAFTSGIFQGVLGLLVVSEVIRHFLYGNEPAY